MKNVELPLVYAGIPTDERHEPGRGRRCKTSASGRPAAPQAERIVGRPAAAGRDRARAGQNRPSIILADEPTGNLDSQTGEEVMTLFDELSTSGATPSSL